VTDTTPMLREAVHDRLPELAAANAELRDLLESLLSPGVVAALKAAPGTAAPDLVTDPDVTNRATVLVRELDTRLVGLRATQPKATVN
jgi:hypothetical protein